MAYIQVTENLPGIASLLAFYRESAKPLMELAQTLLRGDSPLTPGERELIACYVSTQNACTYCASSHGGAAMHLPGVTAELVAAVQRDYQTAPIGDKLKALLAIARKVHVSGKAVSMIDVENARKTGATDREIHDTVLIAAAFCMYNRYVDGLGTWEPGNPTMYDEMGKVLAEKGYVRER